MLKDSTRKGGKEERRKGSLPDIEVPLYKVGMRKSTRTGTISKTFHDSLSRKEYVQNISKQNRTITKKKVELNLCITLAGASRGMEECRSEKKSLSTQDHDNCP